MERLKYEVKWNDEVIARIYIDENGNMKYLQDYKKIIELAKVGLPELFVLTDDENVLPSFIKNRLELATENKALVTDKFTIVDMEEA